MGGGLVGSVISGSEGLGGVWGLTLFGGGVWVDPPHAQEGSSTPGRQISITD